MFCRLVKMHFCVGSSPENFIHSRRVLTFVRGNSFDRQRFGVKRVGQCPLQGFYLARTTLFLSLYNTSLQLLNRSFASGPINVGPVVPLPTVSRRTR